MKVGDKVWFWERHYTPGGAGRFLWINLRMGKIINVDKCLVEVCGEKGNVYELLDSEIWPFSEKMIKKITNLLDE